jgi:hypothetical protein
MWAIFVATIYFGTFITIGILARIILDRVMQKSGVELADVQAQAGPNRRERSVFLLGAWRTER